MAEGITAESVLSKIIQGHLECSICCIRYTEPKMLDCSHSFCLKCLEELKQSQDPDNHKLTCPLCQRETIIPQDRVTKLPNNYTLISLVEEVSKQEQLLQGEGSKIRSKIICQACDEENEAISRCMDCEHYLCQECQKAHQRWAALRTHVIKTLAQLQEVSTLKNESEINIHKCDMHHGQELSLYCITCEQLICKLCTTSHHREPMHTFFNLKKAFDRCLQEVNEGASQLYGCTIPRCVSTRLPYLKDRLDIMLNETQSQISRLTEVKIAKIKQKEISMMQEALAMYKRKCKTLARFVFVEKTVNMIQSAKTDSNHLEILKIRQELFHDYIDVDDGQTENLTYDLSFIGFKESQNEAELGTLLPKEKWELKVWSKFGGELIASFSTGNIVVVNKASEHKLIKLSPSGEVLHTAGQSWFLDHLQNPTAIAVNKDDQLIILDGPTIKIFSQNYQLLNQFKPGKESDIKPTCLAVDDNNMIAVGYKRKEVISLHNSDGSLIKTLAAPGIDAYMAISNKQLIYYTNRDKRTLICVDLNNNKSNTIATYKKHIPYGVCCDKVGDVYVILPTVILTLGSELNIYHYSAGTNPEIIAREAYSVKYIYHDITYTPHGNLAFVGSQCTKIYHRV